MRFVAYPITKIVSQLRLGVHRSLEKSDVIRGLLLIQ
jgi:hypothetical protein